MSTKSPRIQTFLNRVGDRVRDLRGARDWTVQQLADESSLSRRMLTQIELGQANPSLATIDRIAHALDANFADLTLSDEAPSSPGSSTSFDRGDCTPADPGVTDQPDLGSGHTLAWEGPHESTAHLLRASSAPGTELWRWHLGAGVRYQAEPDRAGTEEILHVISGELVLELPDETRILSAGMSTSIPTDQSYSYTAGKEAPVNFIRVVIGA